MRTIEEIRADITAIGKYPKYVGQIAELNVELYKTMTAGIDTERLETICNAERENRVLILPVPIGASVWVPGYFDEVDGSVEFCLDETRLSGYINEEGRAFYTTYDAEYGTMDVEPDLLCTTREAAEIKLEEIKARKRRVCGCTWDHACPGGCYWVEKDLCSKCAELGEPVEVFMDHCQCGMAVDADDEVCPNCERPVVRR